MSLRSLLIEDYALIERAEIGFADGATMFTGETGSGKTMLLGALGFALGDRAASDALRRGAERARVTLAFEPDDELRARLRSDGFELDADEEATVVRELTAGGKSSIRLNGRPATAGYVRDLAGAVADVIGQHEAQRLLAPSFHLELIDRYAGDPALQARSTVAAAHAELRSAQSALDEMEQDARQSRARYDDARAALEEIEGAQLQAGEDERLEERRRILDNAEKIAGILRAAHDAVVSDERGATSAFGSASSALRGIAGIGPRFEAFARQAAALQSDANDFALELARALEETEFDPAELESINTRLAALDRLKRKYGGSIEDVLAHAQAAREVTDAFETRDETLEQRRQRRDAAVDALNEAAKHLSSQRRAAAARLSSGVKSEFRDLALASGRFDVAFESLDAIGPVGAERAQFVFAANAGDELRPLTRVGSGGELSRVLLALIVTLAKARDRSALVFDEIDAGVGGATATAVGIRLGRLAQDGQIVCVTHLAQIATWADRHYVLEKSERGKTASIAIREAVAPEDRIAEVARMLSGESHDVALKHARAMLEQTAKVRKSVAV